MKRDMGSAGQHTAGVVAVVALSMVIHVGLVTGSFLLGDARTPSAMDDGATPTIAAPDSPVWGRAVLRLNGMH